MEIQVSYHMSTLRTKSILKLFTVLLVLGCTGLAKASEKVFINQLPKSGITSLGSLIVMDPMSEQSGDQYKSIVRLKYGRELHTDISSATPWSLTVQYSLTFYDPSGAEVIENDELTIDFDAAGAPVYEQLHHYDSKRYASVTVTSIVTDDINLVPEDIQLELELRKSSFTALGEDPISLGYGFEGKDLNIYWTYMEGAEQYELEWVFVDKEDYTYNNGVLTNAFDFYSANPEQAFDYKEPTSITTYDQYFQYQPVGPHGKYFFRVRGLGRFSDNDGVRAGEWSYVDDQNLYVTYELDESTFQNKNWSYTQGFAEDGKNKKSVEYFDGSLRNRQSLINLSSTDHIMVGETKYDYHGRPVLGLLPVPTEKSQTAPTLGYVAGFNKFSATGNPKDQFDDQTLLDAQPFDVSSGAAKYYSPTNGFNTPMNDYLPDAEGYVYSQTQYSKDGTSKPKVVGSPGKELSISTTGHYSKIFYADANETELKRLFGSEVGNASHYRKQITVDPNDQVSVAYIDQEGRTIASALATSYEGAAGANYNLQQLNDAGDGQGGLADFLDDYDAGSRTLSLNGANFIDKAGLKSFSNSKIGNTVPNNTVSFTYDFIGARNKFDGCEYMKQLQQSQLSPGGKFYNDQIITYETIDGAMFTNCNGVTDNSASTQMIQKILNPVTFLDCWSDELHSIHPNYEVYEDACLTNDPSLEMVCEDCRYYLEVSIIGPDETQVPITSGLETSDVLLVDFPQVGEAIGTDCGPDSYAGLVNFTATFDEIGDYTVSKVLRVNQGDLEVAIADLELAKVGGDPALGYPDDQQIEDDLIGAIDCSGCDVTCEDHCTTQVKEENPGWAVTDADFIVAVHECVENGCIADELVMESLFAECDALLMRMEAQMKPDGYYYDNEHTDVFTVSNIESASLLDEAGDDLEGQSGLDYVLTAENYDDKWSKGLVKIHPEYHFFQTCLTDIPHKAYAINMSSIQSWSEAEEKGYLNPAHMAEVDDKPDDAIIPYDGVYDPFSDWQAGPYENGIDLDEVEPYLNVTNYFDMLAAYDDHITIDPTNLSAQQAEKNGNYDDAIRAKMANYRAVDPSWETDVDHDWDDDGNYDLWEFVTIEELYDHTPNDQEKWTLFQGLYSGIKRDYAILVEEHRNDLLNCSPSTIYCNGAYLEDYFSDETLKNTIPIVRKGSLPSPTTTTELDEVTDIIVDKLVENCDEQCIGNIDSWSAWIEGNCTKVVNNEEEHIDLGVHSSIVNELSTFCSDQCGLENPYSFIFQEDLGTDPWLNIKNTITTNGFACELEELVHYGLEVDEDCSNPIFVPGKLERLLTDIAHYFQEDVTRVIDFQVNYDVNNELQIVDPVIRDFEVRADEIGWEIYSYGKVTDFDIEVLPSGNVDRLYATGPATVNVFYLGTSGYTFEDIRKVHKIGDGPHYPNLPHLKRAVYEINDGTIYGDDFASEDAYVPVNNYETNTRNHCVGIMTESCGCVSDVNDFLGTDEVVPNRFVGTTDNWTLEANLDQKYANIIDLINTAIAKIKGSDDGWGSTDDYFPEFGELAQLYDWDLTTEEQSIVEIFISSTNSLATLRFTTEINGTPTIGSTSLFGLGIQMTDLIEIVNISHVNNSHYKEVTVNTVNGPITTTMAVFTGNDETQPLSHCYQNGYINIEKINFPAPGCSNGCIGVDPWGDAIEVTREDDTQFHYFLLDANGNAFAFDQIGSYHGTYFDTDEPSTLAETYGAYSYTNQMVEVIDVNGISHDLYIYSEAPEDHFFHPCTFDTQLSLADIKEACIADLEEFAIQVAAEEYDNAKTAFNSDFVMAAVNKCFDVPLEEDFYCTMSVAEYHYTLFYYDQSGHLIQTIPPAGVNPLDDSHFTNGTYTGGEPQHVQNTRYKYNSIGELVWKCTPDGGESNIWYDDLGRVRFSQDAEQKSNSAGSDHIYSYVKYDELSRPLESGVWESEDWLNRADGLLGYTETEIATSFGSQINDVLNFPNDDNRKEITTTIYDGITTRLDGFVQENLRGRVSMVWASDDPSNYDRTAATFYSYDIHGNVNRVQQFVPYLGVFSMEYDYDLVSGNVNEFRYQPGKVDQFTHRYSYDADNRMVDTWTSADGYIWDHELHQEYYLHGPLARQEIGSDKVQGNDHYYTLNGWIKGVNTPGHSDATGANVVDPGNDGIGTGRYQFVGQDEFAYTLGYYQGDYKARATVDLGAAKESRLYKSLAQDMSGLYNGNIRTSALWQRSLGEKLGQDDQYGLKRMSYTYDQLNRITASNSAEQYTSMGGWGLGNAGMQSSNYSFDPNGNLETLNRWSAASSSRELMDVMSYKFNQETLNQGASDELSVRVNNKLEYVTDAVDLASVDDFTNQNAGNYSYDAIGNLIKNVAEDIEIITWTQGGKIKTVSRTSGSAANDLEFIYDATGDRIVKISKPAAAIDENDWVYTYYVRDASGQVVANYSRTKQGDDLISVQTEIPIFGGERLGILRPIDRIVKSKDLTTPFQYDKYVQSDLSSVSNASFFETIRSSAFVPDPTGATGNVLALLDYSTGPIYSLELLGGDEADVDIDILAGSNSAALVHYNYSVTYQEGSEGFQNQDQLTYQSWTTESKSYTCPNEAIRCELTIDYEALYGDVYLKDFSAGIKGQSTYGTPVSNDNQASDQKGLKSYELSNQVHNVYTVVSDMKVGVDGTNADGVANYYFTNVEVENDYYPYGAKVVERTFVNDYKYGFNGMEKDNEVAGISNSYDFGARIYDPNIGRWSSSDPLEHMYNSVAPYVFALNTPIQAYDPDGRVVVFVGYYRSNSFIVQSTGESGIAMSSNGSVSGYVTTGLGAQSNASFSQGISITILPNTDDVTVGQGVFYSAGIAMGSKWGITPSVGVAVLWDENMNVQGINIQIGKGFDILPTYVNVSAMRTYTSLQPINRIAFSEEEKRVMLRGFSELQGKLERELYHPLERRINDIKTSLDALDLVLIEYQKQIDEENNGEGRAHPDGPTYNELYDQFVTQFNNLTTDLENNQDALRETKQKMADIERQLSPSGQGYNRISSVDR